MLAVDFITRLSSTSRGAIMARYAIMSLSPMKVRNACMACDTRPPCSTTSS